MAPPGAEINCVFYRNKSKFYVFNILGAVHYISFDLALKTTKVYFVGAKNFVYKMFRIYEKQDFFQIFRTLSFVVLCYIFDEKCNYS